MRSSSFPWLLPNKSSLYETRGGSEEFWRIAFEDFYQIVDTLQRRRTPAGAQRLRWGRPHPAVGGEEQREAHPHLLEPRRAGVGIRAGAVGVRERFHATPPAVPTQDPGQ